MRWERGSLGVLPWRGHPDEGQNQRAFRARRVTRRRYHSCLEALLRDAQLGLRRHNLNDLERRFYQPLEDQFSLDNKAVWASPFTVQSQVVVGFESWITGIRLDESSHGGTIKPSLIPRRSFAGGLHHAQDPRSPWRPGYPRTPRYVGYTI